MAACPILARDSPAGGLPVPVVTIVPIVHATRGDCPPDVRIWLQSLRYYVDEYEDKPKEVKLTDDIDSLNSTDSAEQDHFDLNKYFTATEDTTSESDDNVDVFSDAFDNILSSLGREIYDLDSFHRRYFQERESNLPNDFAQDIIKIFDEVSDECINGDYSDTISSTESEEMELNVPVIRKVPSYSNLSNLSDEVFVSCEDESIKSKKNKKIDRIFDSGSGIPTPPARRKNRKIKENLDSQIKKENPVSKVEFLRAKFDRLSNPDHNVNQIKKPSGSGSDDYQNLWTCSSGHDKSPRSAEEMYATVNVIKYDNVRDINPSIEYGKQKILVCSRPRSAAMGIPRSGAQCSVFESNNQLRCTSECDLNDDCHAALFGTQDSYRSSLCSSSGPGACEQCDGIEVTSDCDSWTMVPRSSDDSVESPLYENLSVYQRTITPRPIPPDVLDWRNHLLDPYCNDDEEDEWISTEEALLYSKEQKPPFIIPRIKLARGKAVAASFTDDSSSREDDEERKSPSIKSVRRMFEERGFRAGTPPDYSKGIYRPEPHESPAVRGLLLHQHHHFPGYVEPAIDLRHHHHHDVRHGRVKSLITPSTMVATPLRLLPRPYDPNDPNILYEGPVHRTKLTENGKKVRKNWHNNFMVVTQTAIAFYKDAKSYHAARPSSGNSSNVLPELVVSLSGALVSACTAQHTSRPNTCLVTTSRHDQHILQHDAPGPARVCFETILAAINRLPSDYTCPDNSFTNQTPSPTPRHLSKSNHKVSEDSVEDLTESQEHLKVRSKLKKFFIRRPTVDLLIKKGIYKDEPVFGRNLEQVCPDVNPKVPEFVTRCIKAIEISEENMTTDGLYRASGNLSQVQKIRLEVDQNNLSILDKENDVHVLTGALKLFFRELKEPLIPFKFFQKALNASLSKSYESRLKEFREIVNALPEHNRQTLKCLLEHLLRVTSHQEQNRMHISNLAIVFGPTLMWAPSESAHNMAIDCLQQNQVIEILLTDFDDIFASINNNNSIKKKTADRLK